MTHSKRASHAHWPKSGGRRKAAQRSKAKTGRKKSAYPYHITPYGNG